MTRLESEKPVSFLQQHYSSSPPSDHDDNTSALNITDHYAFVSQLPMPTLTFAATPPLQPSATAASPYISTIASHQDGSRTVLEETGLLQNGGRWKRRVVLFTGATPENGGEPADDNPSRLASQGQGS